VVGIPHVVHPYGSSNVNIYMWYAGSPNGTIYGYATIEQLC
jgi:hypothetical protein